MFFTCVHSQKLKYIILEFLPNLSKKYKNSVSPVFFIVGCLEPFPIMMSTLGLFPFLTALLLFLDAKDELQCSESTVVLTVGGLLEKIEVSADSVVIGLLSDVVVVAKEFLVDGLAVLLFKFFNSFGSV